MSALQFTTQYPATGSFCWSSEYQIFYLLQGTLLLRVQDREYHFSPEDFLVINPFSPYQVLESDHAMLLCMEMPVELLRQSSSYPDERRIQCFSAEHNEGRMKYIRQVRHTFANLFTLYSRENKQSHLRSQSKALLLFDILFAQFSENADTREESLGRSEKTFYYIQQSIAFAQEHFHESITIENAAQPLGISANHLSRCLRRYLNLSFMDVVQQFRMRQALREVENSDKTITEIAYDNGFSGSSAFITKFRAQFGCTPLVYRRKKLQEPQSDASQPELVQGSAFQSINKYADRTVELTSEQAAPRSVARVSCSVEQQGEPLDPAWKRVMCIGWASEGLSAVIQKQISMVQHEIGFDYLRFHGIFGDDMSIYNEDETGRPFFNFTYCDILLDYMQSEGLKPYLELGLMPGKLAKHPEICDIGRAHISMPTDWDKWDALVHAFILHCIQRYGIRNVREWRFTPMMCNHILYDFFTWDEYMQMHLHIWNILKFIDDQLIIGGPGIDISVLLDDWDNSFAPYMAFCQENDCMPNFITLKVYPFDMTPCGKNEWFRAQYGDSLLSNMSEDEDVISHMLSRTALLLRRYGYNQNSIAVEAWNSSYSNSDPCNDICYKSAFIVKNIIENQSKVWCMAYWSLSDYMTDINIPKEQRSFHGGVGLLTYDGLRKAGYQAFRLLNLLRGWRIAEGQGYSIFRDEMTVQIIAYQYCHYNLYHCQEVEQSSEVDDPYLLCYVGERQSRVFELTGLPFEEYEVETFMVGQRHGGSTYAKWQEIGAPDRLTDWQREHVARASSSQYSIHRIPAENGKIELRCVVDPHDVILIRLTPVDYGQGQLK